MRFGQNPTNSNEYALIVSAEEARYLKTLCCLVEDTSFESPDSRMVSFSKELYHKMANFTIMPAHSGILGYTRLVRVTRVAKVEDM